MKIYDFETPRRPNVVADNFILQTPKTKQRKLKHVHRSKELVNL